MVWQAEREWHVSKLQIHLIDSAWGMSNMDKYEGIALRELLFCLKGEMVRKKLIIRVIGPCFVDKNEVSFNFDEGTASCSIQFDGLDEDSIESFGMDKLQALSLSVDNIDLYLKSFINKYDFYWVTGEPYFD
jgi:hypothetical protein